MISADKPLVWLGGEVKTPPFSLGARVQAGMLLRRLQRGERIGLPRARPMPQIGSRCIELRISDGPLEWRIICRTDSDAVVIGHVFAKKTTRTPPRVLEACERRFRSYDARIVD
jgi:phage-related protein